jgi:MFS family permease
VPDSAAIEIRPEKEYGYLTLLRVILRTYPKRAVLGGTLMISQSFLYNAIFFTQALVLTKFYHVSNNAVPIYGLAFAVGNLAGPLLLGHLFDTLGRRKMISGTYLISGSVLAFSAWLFGAGLLNAAGQVAVWVVVFFFAGLTIGYLIGGGIMIIGGLVEVFLGIDAEGKSLESVARPLTQVGSSGGGP